MNKPLKFDPNTDEHLEWALKLAYKHILGDFSISSGEATDALCDALCNLIGSVGFCEFVEDEMIYNK